MESNNFTKTQTIVWEIRKMKFTIFDNGKDTVVVEQVRYPHCKLCNQQIRYNKPNKICWSCDDNEI